MTSTPTIQIMTLVDGVIGEPVEDTDRNWDACWRTAWAITVRTGRKTALLNVFGPGTHASVPVRGEEVQAR